jgi:hypothetical protein
LWTLPLDSKNSSSLWLGRYTSCDKTSMFEWWWDEDKAQNCPALISLSNRSAFSVPGSSLKSSLKIEYALHA